LGYPEFEGAISETSRNKDLEPIYIKEGLVAYFVWRIESRLKDCVVWKSK